jgi:hypothetical protein
LCGVSFGGGGGERRGAMGGEQTTMHNVVVSWGEGSAGAHLTGETGQGNRTARWRRFRVCEVFGAAGEVHGEPGARGHGEAVVDAHGTNI